MRLPRSHSLKDHLKLFEVGLTLIKGRSSSLDRPSSRSSLSSSFYVRGAPLEVITHTCLLIFDVRVVVINNAKLKQDASPVLSYLFMSAEPEKCTIGRAVLYGDLC